MIIPFILSFALSLLVGMLDTIMVSTVGDAAVSGVSLVDNVFQLIVFVFMAFGTGGAVISGQYLGDGHDEKASACMEQLLWLSGAVACLLTVLVFIGRPWILGGFFGRITEEVLREAHIYLIITLFSLPAMAIYEAGIATIRSLGDARSTLRISIVMNIINVAGNAVLIFAFHMGTAGVAWPTLVSRWVAAVLAVVYFTKPERRIRFSGRKVPVFSPELVLRILKVGIPNGVENGIFQLGKLIVIRVVAVFGTPAIAANAVAVILTNIISVPGWGTNNAIMTVVARCVGRRDTEQARYYLRLLTAVSVVLLTVWAGMICLGLPLILRLFGSLTLEARTLARYMVYCHAAGTVLCWVPAFLWPAALRAAGDVNYVMIVSIVSMWIFRVGGACLIALVLGAGAVGVWAAMVIDWVFRAVLYVRRWKSGAWESKRVI